MINHSQYCQHHIRYSLRELGLFTIFTSLLILADTNNWFAPLARTLGLTL